MINFSRNKGGSILNKKVVGGVVAGIILIAGGVVAGLMLGKEDTETPVVIISASPLPSPKASPAPSNSMESEAVNVDDTFYRYVNKRLGYSILVPIRAYVSCGPGAGSQSLPIKFFESSQSSSSENTYLAADCPGITVANLDAREPANVPGWKLQYRTVRNDAELDQFIGQKFGGTCRAGEKKPSTQPGVFNVDIRRTDGGPDSGCFVNYGVAIKYSSTAGKAVIWNLGQSPTFFSSARATGSPYDTRMQDNFRFE